MMSMCTVFSCVVGRGCLLWPLCSPGKILLAFSLFILYSKAKFACYPRCFLNSYFCIPVPYNEKDIFWVLVLRDLVGLHRTIQLQLLQHYWLGHRLGLLWYWMVCLGNKQRTFCHFWDCIHVLWKILKEMGIPDHLTCLLRNLYADQETTIRTGHGTTGTR